jgi:predicted nucleic acid-binding protein
LAVTDATILDTGPLVAFLDADEQHHAWVVDRFREVPAHFLTCEPVLAEACYLLGCAPAAMLQIDEYLDRGWITLPFQFSTERAEVMNLMRQYQNIPMSLADACLVRMSELFPDAPIFTLDRHFRVYRRHRKQPIPVMMPM